jgi:hypothetical protein
MLIALAVIFSNPEVTENERKELGVWDFTLSD